MSEYNNWREPINSSIIDHTTIVKNHNVYTHLGCVFIRCIIGVAILLLQNNKNFQNKWIQYGLIIGCIITMIVFATKHFVKKNPLWKVYLRTVIAYGVIGLMIHQQKYDIAGTIIITDALLGLQSRHMAHIASYLSQKNNP